MSEWLLLLLYRLYFTSSSLWNIFTRTQGPVIVKTDPKRMSHLNKCYTTISGHFFAMFMFIFHKNQVQRVILICIMVLNFNWFKIYGLKCILRLNATLANSNKNGNWQMAILWPFLDIFWPTLNSSFTKLRFKQLFWGADRV